MMLLRVLVIDDEPLARRRLEQHLEHMPDVVCAGTASGCREGVECIARLQPDVVLLDIRMRDGTGFDLVDQISSARPPKIIFVTAFDRHAVRAFETSATDFLVKPVEFTRLEEALGRARGSLQQRARAELVDEMQELVANLRAQLLDDAPASPYETEFWVRHRVTGFVRLAVSSIRWIEAEDDYVRLVTAGESHLMRGTLKDLEGRLDPQQFLRIHRSTIVRLSQVDGFLTRAGNMEAVMSCGARLRVGRSQAKEVRGALRLRERSGGSVQGEQLPSNRPLRGLPPL